jgi:hypothetical protein
VEQTGAAQKQGTSSIVKPGETSLALVQQQEINMAKGNRSQKKEIRKPKKEKPKAAPATSRRVS